MDKHLTAAVLIIFFIAVSLSYMIGKNQQYQACLMEAATPDIALEVCHAAYQR